MRRVVITAVGVTSPIGSGLEEFSQRLFAGDTGAQLLNELFGSKLAESPVAFGAPVRDPRVFEASKRLTLPHRSITFALSALDQILATDPQTVRMASLQCGVGIGQLLPDLPELSGGGDEVWHRALQQRARDARSVPAGARANGFFADEGALQLQRVLGLAGPAQNFVSACAAATQACIQACEEVRLGAPVALGGGHDSLLSVPGLYLMHELGTLSLNTPDYRRAVRPFDRNRDGTMIGEGAAYFLFEELEHALSRNATILAEVMGYGSSLDGHHVTSPDPNGSGGIRMIKDALSMAGLSAADIDYVNAHGTATSMNDPIEAHVIAEALKGHRPYVSSSKPQFGHLIAACGAVELAACVAALTRQRVPPNCNLEDPDPECDLRFPSSGGPPASLSYVLSNSFGFGGQNACFILGHWGPRRERREVV